MGVIELRRKLRESFSDEISKFNLALAFVIIIPTNV